MVKAICRVRHVQPRRARRDHNHSTTALNMATIDAMPTQATNDQNKKPDVENHHEAAVDIANTYEVSRMQHLPLPSIHLH